MDSNSAEWRAGPSIPTVCRCCLAEGCYKDISTEYFWMGKREVYAEMLTETFDISIAYSHSGGPNSQSRLICEPCISRLRDASEFKRQVQECEKTFLQHLDPGRDMSLDAPTEIVTKEVKIEAVKLEKSISDDDDNFDDHMGFGDDDDDDLDDQPLTRLATKTPKKESVDILDLLDNAKAAEKRKCTIKLKSTPAKKVKKDGRLAPKATTSKQQPKPEAKKKEIGVNFFIRRNAKILVEYMMIFPFRLPEEKMVCVYCCTEFDTPSAFRKHMSDDHHNFKSKIKVAFLYLSDIDAKVDCTDLRCRSCPVTFDTLEDAARHVKEKHDPRIDLNISLGLQPFRFKGDQLSCALCNMNCSSIRTLSRHTNTHFRKFTCDSCGRSYATSSSLQKHVIDYHGTGKYCTKCKTYFPTSEARRIHKLESKRCCPYICNKCGERFLSATIKKNHLETVHGVLPEVISCRECNETFRLRSKYNEHFKLAHTDRNFLCGFCGKKFPTKRNLDRHRVTHTGEKNYPCTVCSKSFAGHWGLTQHMWTHSEFKRFECKLCNKQFNQKVCWKTHMKSHHPELINE